MLSLDEINNTIEQLENSSTTFDVCSKLASLIIVKQHLENVGETKVSTSGDVVVKEYDDILPQYRMYCEIKRKYQMHEMTEEAVHLAIKDVCKEINEFLHILYSNTDTQVERDCIKEMLMELGSEL
jgi:hypothetical protein